MTVLQPLFITTFTNSNFLGRFGPRKAGQCKSGLFVVNPWKQNSVLREAIRRYYYYYRYGFRFRDSGSRTTVFRSASTIHSRLALSELRRREKFPSKRLLEEARSSHAPFVEGYQGLMIVITKYCSECPEIRDNLTNMGLVHVLGENLMM
jgi:hypothetical protein